MKPPRIRHPDSRLRLDLRRIQAEGVAWSVMVGLGETYFPAFALALGMGEVGAGLLATLPLLAGGLLQLVTPRGVALLGSRRRWATACAAVQAAAFLPLIAGAVAGRLPTLLLFTVAAVYWGSGMAAGPAWNVWMETLVPRRIRARYFSRRSRALQVGVLAALSLGGVLLDLTEKAGSVLLGFTVLFIAGALARAVSARLLSLQSEATPPVGGERILTAGELLDRVRRGREGPLLVYLTAMTAAVAFASAYFTPYLLERLDLTYSAYMVLIGASFASKGLALTFLGDWIRRFGVLRVLRASGAGIALIPFFWIGVTAYPALLILQIFAGIVWAAHELASFLLFFDTMRAEERTSLLTAHNLANAGATVAGSLLGGALLAALGPAGPGYAAVFAVSGAARVLALLPLARLRVDHEPELRLDFRVVAVRPSIGPILRPILASLERLRPAAEPAHPPREARNTDAPDLPK